MLIFLGVCFLYLISIYWLILILLVPLYQFSKHQLKKEICNAAIVGERCRVDYARPKEREKEGGCFKSSYTPCLNGKGQGVEQKAMSRKGLAYNFMSKGNGLFFRFAIKIFRG